MNRVEIIVVGREILVGRTRDTNSNWIARRVASLGGRTSRIVAVDDDVQSIAKEIRTGRSNRARVIITIGGLGPTADDKTLAAVAEATGTPLELDIEALEFVRKRYGFFKDHGFVDSDKMTASRKKMALLPVGSRILRNSVGAAPGVHLDLKTLSLFCVPGVPEEMEAIFEEEMVDTLKGIFGKNVFLEKTITTTLKDESLLADILNRVMKDIPRVYLKSRPTHFGRNVNLNVTISVTGDNRGDVEREIRRAVLRIRKGIREETAPRSGH
ncbi:MAG: competence/damage-inducible protein A [Proteobacteria bacterium]|nr:competence/damage-inducible protein A [Pseudomonadota bacterium]